METINQVIHRSMPCCVESNCRVCLGGDGGCCGVRGGGGVRRPWWCLWWWCSWWYCSVVVVSGVCGGGFRGGRGHGRCDCLEMSLNCWLSEERID